MHRVTASAMHGAKLGSDGQWSSVVVWGANKFAGADLTQSVLVESEAILGRNNTLIGRGEWLQKSAEDLVLDTPSLGFPSGQVFNVSELSLGYIRELTRWSGATLGLGAMGTLNVVPSSIASVYGSRTPLGGLLFIRLRPTKKSADAMGGMRMHDMNSMRGGGVN